MSKPDILAKFILSLLELFSAGRDFFFSSSKPDWISQGTF